MGKPSFEIFQRLRRSDAGFSIAELVTVAAIVGVLSAVGIANYRSQQHKAQTAEAKHSLASLYSLETEFRNTWGTYHGNLVLLGAVPRGIKMYDVGFTDGMKGPGNTLSSPEGLAANHYAEVPECSTYFEICDTGPAGCAASAKTANASTPLAASQFSCSVESGDYKLSDDAGGYKAMAPATYSASDSAFKAAAVGKLNSADEWSIDQKQNLIRVQNGEN